MLWKLRTWNGVLSAGGVGGSWHPWIPCGYHSSEKYFQNVEFEEVKGRPELDHLKVRGVEIVNKVSKDILVRGKAGNNNDYHQYTEPVVTGDWMICKWQVHSATWWRVEA